MQRINVKLCLGLMLAFFISACVSTPGNIENKLQTQAVDYNPPKTNLNLGLLGNLIGKWKVQDWQLQKNGEWQEQAGATWTFYAIQGGTAIRDEWVSNISDAQASPGFGSQLRVYNPWKQTWSAAWLSSRTRSIDFYNGSESESEVLFVSEDSSDGKLTQIIFSDIQENSFSWQMQWSSNAGESWTQVYKLQAIRVNK